MKDAEDEAFDDLARKQGAWGGGFPAKRQMAADKLQEPWNEDEWRRNNWRCSHGWLRGEQCEICNAAQPPSEWAGIKAILDEYGLQAIDFVADFKAALAQPAQEPVAWHWLGSAHFRKKIPKNADITAWNPVYIPPQREWVGLTDDEMWNAYTGGSDIINLDYAKAIEAKLKEKNNGT